MEKGRDTMKRMLLTNLLLLIFALQGNAQNYNGAWNTPTISHRNYPDKIYFGYVDAHDKRPGIDASTLPAIPSLRYRSCCVVCPKDSCHAQRAVMAMRCPKDKILLDWASRRAKCFVEWCDAGQIPQDTPDSAVSLTSATDICNNYIKEVERAFRGNSFDDCFEGRPNVQFGYLLTDCWATDKYCTFYEATWYDELSCGDNTTQSYYSIDKKTGKVAMLADFVKEEDFPALAHKLTKYLKCANGELWIDLMPEDYTVDEIELLNSMNGCAIIKEGLVIYYHPYAIGSGADGQFTAVIPIRESTAAFKQ